MTTSGTVGLTVIDLATILEHAFRRCKIPASYQTPELVAASLENLHFLLNELACMGLTLWTIERIILGLYLYQESYLLPVGTVDVLDTYLRHSMRAGGVLSSSGGENVEALEDQNILTSTTQVAPGGSFVYTFTNPVAVRTVGLLHKGNIVRKLVFEFSQDGVSWATDKALSEQLYEDEKWYWVDVDPARAGLYFRIRDTLLNAPLAAYELFASSDIQNKILMARMNRDDFTALPNDFNRGRPLQFWLDRDTPQPILRVWPSPGEVSFYDQVITYVHRQVQDVGRDLTLTLDIPPRWLEAIVSGLSVKVALESDKVDPGIIPSLEERHQKALGIAESEEVDKSPMVLRPNISHYTRGR